MRITDLPTPQVLVDSARLRANIARHQAAADVHGIRVRPHSKTHKSPVIARAQIEAGAVGICCAKIGEAEVFALGGIDDIRLPYPIHPTSADRLLALMDRARLSIIVDHLGNAQAWSEVMTRHQRRLPVLVKVDVGFHRCGIEPDAASARAFLREVSRLPGLELLGVLSHAGHGYHAASEEALLTIAREEASLLESIKSAAARDGIEIREVSVGATPTARFSVGASGVTELRAGNYVFYDRTQVGLGAANREDCALSVMATVVTKPAPNRLILDCGSKTLSSDVARGFRALPGYGDITPALDALEVDETLCIERLSEEHATVRAATGSTRLEPGDRVRVLPNHACVVTNLVDTMYLVDGLSVVSPLPVAARGRIQ